MGRMYRAAVLLSVVSLVSAACGGGGGGGDAASSTSSTPTVSYSRLFYTGSLHFIDTSVPNSAVVVDVKALTDIIPVFENRHSINRKYVMYIAGGKLWRVSAEAGGHPAPVQVSNAANLDTAVCPYSPEIGLDEANVDNSQYVYATAGSDVTCRTKDDVWYVVTITDAATVAPRAALQPMVRYQDGANQTRWLAMKTNGDVVITDADFANPSAALITASTSASYVAHAYPESLGIYVQVDNTLRKFNPATGVLSASLHTLGAMSSVATNYEVADNNNLYFVDGVSIYRVAHNGTASVEMVREATGTLIDHEMQVAPNHIVYRTQNGAAVAVRSITKTAALGLPLTLASTTTTNLTLRAGAGNYVFIQEETATGYNALIRSAAGGININNNNAYWLGVIFVLDNAMPDGFRATHVVRVTGLNGKSAAGGSVSSMAADTLNTVTLGTLDNDITQPLYTQGLGSNGLLLNVGATTLTDIYYVNPVVAGSLARVTATSGTEETPLGY